MDRVYEQLLREHFKENRQMAFLSGPRQVGKTTISKMGDQNNIYLSWDNQKTRQVITAGPDSLAHEFELEGMIAKSSRIIFDEIHKYSKWKSFLKGYFDEYGDGLNTLVTGSARLNIFKRGGDSLMGRYFLYRMHPLSIAELERTKIYSTEIAPPKKPALSTLKTLLRFGGFPEPFLRDSTRFYNRWRKLRTDQLFHEDLRDLSGSREVDLIEVLAQLLKHRVGQQVNMSSLARDVNVSVDTIGRWIAILESTYYCFSIRPWHRNVPKSLRKQPKIFLWDWSLASTQGAKNENLIASHLLKAVHTWTDMGIGEYGLYYLRDKTKREVDFVVTKNGDPWFMVEVKSSKRPLSKSLDYFQKVTGAKSAFQVEMNEPYIDENCFEFTKPTRVPAMTLLSQLC